jgi:hypothetical protein
MGVLIQSAQCAMVERCAALRRHKGKHNFHYAIMLSVYSEYWLKATPSVNSAFTAKLYVLGKRRFHSKINILFILASYTVGGQVIRPLENQLCSSFVFHSSARIICKDDLRRWLPSVRLTVGGRRPPSLRRSYI